MQPSSTVSSIHAFQLDRHTKAYLFLNLIVVVALCATIITAGKIVTVGPLSFACCNLIFALLTFPITDTISEIFGIKHAKLTVYIGSITQLLFLFLIQFSLYVPAASFWENEAAYNSVLAIGPRVVFASLIAFFLSSLADVTIYAKFKKYNRGRFLWIRNNISTSVGQIINAILFMTITFYGTGLPLMKLILGSIALRFLMAGLDTPFVYLGVKLVNKYLHGQTIAYTPDE